MELNYFKSLAGNKSSSDQESFGKTNCQEETLKLKEMLQTSQTQLQQSREEKEILEMRLNKISGRKSSEAENYADQGVKRLS